MNPKQIESSDMKSERDLNMNVKSKIRRSIAAAGILVAAVGAGVVAAQPASAQLNAGFNCNWSPSFVGSKAGTIACSGNGVTAGVRIIKNGSGGNFGGFNASSVTVTNAGATSFLLKANGVVVGNLVFCSFNAGPCS